MGYILVRVKMVVFNITRIPVTSVPSKVESVLVKMKNNPKFINPKPPLAQVETENEDLIQAIAKAKDGSKTDKAKVPEKLYKLKLSISTLMGYVETTANSNAAIASSVIASSGMDEKRFTPRKKKIFEVKNTDSSGNIKVWCPRTKKDIVFGFEYTQTPDDESFFVPAEFSPAASRIITDLIAGKRCYIRWASITSTGQTDWSDVISIMVT